MYSNVKSTELPWGLIWNSRVGSGSQHYYCLLCVSATWFEQLRTFILIYKETLLNSVRWE